MRRLLLCAIWAAALAAAAVIVGPARAAYEPTEAYRQRTVKGFTVLLGPVALRHEPELDAALDELEAQLGRVVDAVPAPALAHLRKLTNLRKLNLLGGPVTDDGAAILAGLPHLQELNLYRSDITNSGLAKLSALRELTTLDVRYTKVTRAGVDGLRSAIPKCRVEFAGGAPAVVSKVAAPKAATEAAVTDWVKAVGGKVESRESKVRGVSLRGTAVTDTQLKPLAAFSALERLDLSGTEIGDLGVEVIAGLGALRELSLAETTVSDRALVKLTGLKHLTSLSLAGIPLHRAPSLPPPESLSSTNSSPRTAKRQSSPYLDR